MLAYCDFVADRVQKGLVNVMNDALQPVRLTEVSKVSWDLGPQGEFASTKKTLFVADQNGKRYRVTVEEA